MPSPSATARTRCGLCRPPEWAPNQRRHCTGKRGGRLQAWPESRRGADRAHRRGRFLRPMSPVANSEKHLGNAAPWSIFQLSNPFVNATPRLPGIRPTPLQSRATAFPGQRHGKTGQWTQRSRPGWRARCSPISIPEDRFWPRGNPTWPRNGVPVVRYSWPCGTA